MKRSIDTVSSKINPAIKGTVDTITNVITHPHTIRLFRKLVYIWFLVNTLILLPKASEFWGAHSFIPDYGYDQDRRFNFLHLLNQPSHSFLYIGFLVGQIVSLIIGIRCIYPRITSIVIYFFTINLDSKAFVILDGGNNLMEILLIYLIFMDPSLQSNKFRSPVLNHTNCALSNYSFYMARIQLVLVYLVSGLAKVTGTLWQNGTALYYTLNIDEYSHPIAKTLISHSPLLSVLGTYATVLYQVSFPWLVWNRKIRPYLLSFGTFLHIQISFVMGLFMFGFAIAVSYFSFTSDELAKKLLALFQRNRQGASPKNPASGCRPAPAVGAVTYDPAKPESIL